MYLNKDLIIDLDDFINNKYKILAHINEDKEESLKEHTNLSLKYFYMIVKEKNLENIFKKFEEEFLKDFPCEARELFIDMIINTITLHDIGKINPCFQKLRLHNNLKINQCNPSKNSRHSMLSSILYINHYFYKIKLFKGYERDVLLDFMIMNAYVISRHHGELNSLKLFKDKFSLDGEGERLLEEERILFESTYNKDVKITVNKIGNIFEKVEKIEESYSKDKKIYRYIYERVMLSLLVASDFYSTTEFMDDIEMTNLGTINNIDDFYDSFKNGPIYKLIRKYEKNYYGKNEDFTNITDINILRNELFLDAEKTLEHNIDKDIFYLEAPTGSGKSNVATNLSFKILEEDKSKNKIFYVYPFNTLVEQNIKTLEKIFKDKLDILSKIAVINSIEPIKIEKDIYKKEESLETLPVEYYKKALLNREFLNYPMVLTTHVTLFKYLFNTSKESIFPIYQLANSVIVLDEIQSYKNMIWGEIITFLKAYSKILNIKVVIMSATLPNLDKLALTNGETIKLINNRDKYFKNHIFKNRVKLDYSLLYSQDIEEDLYEHVKNMSFNNKKILVEFISKKAAYSFYNRLKEDDKIKCDVELMSGDDNLKERERILDKVSISKNIILVATQVIEAGVDIDMDIGYKNISLFDSEEQFLGRINRSCKKNDATAYFFKIDEAKEIYKDDVRNNKDITLLEDEIKNILVEKDFYKVYDIIIDRLKSKTGGINELNIENFFKDEIGSLDFKKVEEKMTLIKDDKNEISIFLCSDLKMENGETLIGNDVWNEYKTLLLNKEMEYSERKVKLSNIRSKMNNFIYKIKWNENFIYNDKIGELCFIEEGDKYFKEGKLDKEKFITGIGEFI